MRYSRRFQLFILAALAAIGACRAPDGHWITMVEWWAQHHGDKSGTDKPHAHTAAASQPTAAALAARTEPRRGLNPAPAGSLLPTVLTINDETITVEDVLEPVRPRLEQAAKELSSEDYYAMLARSVRQGLMEEISERLVWREAKREITDDMKKRLDAAVDRLELDRINSEFGGRESRYEKYLASLNKPRATVKERLKRRIVVDQYLRDRLIPQIAIRKSDLQRYFEEHRSDFSKPRQIDLQMIEAPFKSFLPGGGPPTDPEKEAARRRALAHVEKCQGEIRAGASFEEVARRESRGLHSEDGGAWGLISAPLRGPYEAPTKAAFALQPEEVSPIIETANGYFLVRVRRIVAGRDATFESAQSEISWRLREEQFAELRERFLRRTLAQAEIGDVEPFVQAIVSRAPETHRSQAARKSER